MHKQISLDIWELGTSIYEHCKLEINITSSLFLPKFHQYLLAIMIWLFSISINSGIFSSLAYKPVNFSCIIKNSRKPNEMQVLCRKFFVANIVISPNIGCNSHPWC